MNASEIQTLVQAIIEGVVTALKKEGIVCNTDNPAPTPKTERTAYQKTETLLYAYNNFKKLVEKRMEEIEELKQFGVPGSCGGVKEYVNKGGMPSGIVLPEESVDNAIANVQRSVQGTVQAIDLVDKSMAALKNDPYYDVLVMFYFEGRTQEDIAVMFNCTQKTISINKARLVKELSIQMFPDQVAREYMN